MRGLTISLRFIVAAALLIAGTATRSPAKAQDLSSQALVRDVAAHPSAPESDGAIAVIVNRNNPIDNVTAADLRRLYLGNTTVFSNRERVVLLEQAGLRESFYRTVLNMSSDRVKRHWIGVVFSGSGATPPKTVSQADLVLDFVRHARGAIAFVDARVVDPTVKVLAVEGSRPGDPDYALWTLSDP